MQYINSVYSVPLNAFQVEVISVHSNDVASVTARHPVGVVVAERRVGPPAAGAPRPVFIPGCPLPQILSQDTASAELVQQKEPAHTSSKVNVQKPLRDTVHPQAAEIDKTLRGTNEDKENYPLDKEYDPSVYVDPLHSGCSQLQHGQRFQKLQRTRDMERTGESMHNSNSNGQVENMSPRLHSEMISSSVESEQNSSNIPLQMGECSSKDTKRIITRESSHTGPARHVLLHRGLHETSDSSGSGGEDLKRNTTETSMGPVSQTATSEKPYSKNDYLSTAESEYSSDLNGGTQAADHEVGSVTSSSDTTDTESLKCATGLQIKGKEDKRAALTEEMKDPQASRVVQMKRGSLSVRSLPHDTRNSVSDRHRNARGASVVSRGARGTVKCARVPQRRPATLQQQVSGKIWNSCFLT